MEQGTDKLSMENHSISKSFIKIKTSAVCVLLGAASVLTGCESPDIASVTGVSSTAEYAATSGNSDTTSNAAIGALLLINGNNQSVTQGLPAAKSLTVLAVDSSGLPKSGVVVAFEVVDDTAGSLTGGATYVERTTGSNGRASVGFTAGSSLGATSVVATSSTGSAVFNLMIGSSVNATTAGSILLATGGNNQGIPKGIQAPKKLEVLALNNYGSAMAGVNVSFNVASTGMGTFHEYSNATTATVTTDSEGRASIWFTAANIEGPASVVASSNAGSAVFSLNVYTPGSTNSTGSTLMVTNGNNETVEPSTTAPKNLEVMALNSLGIPMQGVEINFELLTAGAGTFNGGSDSFTGSGTTTQVTTGSNGRAWVSFAASSSSGTASIIARSTAGNAVFTLQIGTNGNTIASGSMLLAANGNNQTAVKNTAADKNLEVLAINHLGIPIPGVSVTFDIITSGAGTLTGGTSGTTTSRTGTTDSNGRLAVSFTAGNNAGGASIVARSASGSTVFNLNIIDSSSSNTLGSALLITGGNNQVLEQNTLAPLDLEVLAVNSNGSPIQNITVTFQVSSGSLTHLTRVTDSNGRASTQFTPGTQLGPISVIATSSAGSNVFNLTVGTQGAGSTLSISGGNGQLLLPNSNASNPLEVIATNSTGAPLSNIPITFTVTTTNGGVLGASQLQSVTTNTDSNGKALTTFRSSNYVGSVSILASSQIGSVTFSLNTNTVTGGGSGGSGQVLVFAPTTLTPATGTWINTEVGNAPSKSITLTNASATNLYLNSIFTTTQIPFKVSTDDCPRSPAAFPTNTSCTINIQFTPQTGGTFNRSLFVNWSALNDGSNGSNAVLSLEGSGPAPLIFAGLTNASNTTTTQTQLNWVAASGGTNTQYRIYDTTSTASLIATLPPNTTSYTVTGLIPNSVYKYKAYAVNSAGVEDGNTSEITITTGAMNGPALTTITNFVYPATYIRASYTNLSADINSSVTSNDTGPNGAISYACKFSRVVNGTSTSKLACTQPSLGGTFSFNTTTGQISWTPKFGTQGVFEFQITGTDTVGSTAQYFTVNVIHAYGSATQGTLNLATILADYRASFANRSQQNTTTATSWLNTLNSSFTASVTGNPNFNGSSLNSTTDPERFTFDGSTQVNFGDILQGRSQFMIDYWLSNPESTYTNNSVVMKMDTNGSDNGFKITQNTLANGSRAMRFDFERNYNTLIQSHNPSAYWRMDEGRGSTFDDVIGTNDLVYGDGAYGSTTTDGLITNQPGATMGEKTSTSVKMHTNRLNIPNVALFKPTGNFTVEFWVKYDNSNLPADHDLYAFNSTGTANGLRISMESGVLTVRYKPANAATFTLTPTYTNYGAIYDGNWHHIAFTSTSTNSKILFLDGNKLSVSEVNNGAITWPGSPDGYWFASGGDPTNAVSMDEIAFYGFALSHTQIQDHMAAGDHFIRNQSLFPANAVSQTKPKAYWRGSDGWAVMKDYSGNQLDIFSNDNNYSMYRTTGVYSGRSGLDQDTAYYTHDYVWYYNYVDNPRALTLNDKFTYSTWINFSNSGNNTPLFSFVNYGGSSSGFMVYVNGGNGRIYAHFDRSWSTAANTASTASAVVPFGSNTVLPTNTWYHIAMTYDGTKSNNKKVQFYVNGVPVKMADATGTIPTTLSSLTGTGWRFELANCTVANGHICGSKTWHAHDEDSYYDRVLPVNEIRAHAFEGSLRYCDINVTSQGLDPVNTKPFDYINMLYDGTTMNIRRNSKLECSLRPTVNLTGESFNLVAGATTNGFKGHITDLRVHGSDAPTTVATAPDQQVAFYKSADQHHVVPLGDIVTTNLVRWYEPSTAMDGLRPHPAGCTDNQLNWTDMGHSLNGIGQENANLRNFTGCTTNGWKGTGIPTDPYRLNFDGVDDWVDLGSKPFYNTNPKKLTVCVWTRTTQYAESSIFSRGSGWGDFNLGSYQSTLWLYLNGTYTQTNGTNNNLHRNGLWHYTCGQADGSNYRIYLDGNVIMGPVGLTSDLSNNGSHDVRASLGRIVSLTMSGQNGSFYSGEMGGVHIYNDGLTQAQIKQNCAAQAANYNMTTCAP
jgi:hypothetical protein